MVMRSPWGTPLIQPETRSSRLIRPFFHELKHDHRGRQLARACPEQHRGVGRGMGGLPDALAGNEDGRRDGWRGKAIANRGKRCVQRCAIASRKGGVRQCKRKGRDGGGLLDRPLIACTFRAARLTHFSSLSSRNVRDADEKRQGKQSQARDRHCLVHPCNRKMRPSYSGLLPRSTGWLARLGTGSRGSIRDGTPRPIIVKSSSPSNTNAMFTLFRHSCCQSA
jgi:hypothetical protein